MNKNLTMIKKCFFVFIFTLLFNFNGVSQNSDSEKIEQLKIAFFTERLNLSAEEAKRFWPVYNKHTRLYDQLRDEQWSSVKSRLNKVESLSSKESEVLLKDYLDYKKTRVDYRVDFVNDLKDVITPKQIMMLKKAEYDFHKKLLKQYQSDKSSKK